MWELAKLDERARQLRQQIVELREVSRTRQERQAEALLA
jgi:hypothetical protein